MSTSENLSRKRPAPGTSPVGYPSNPQQMQNMYQNGSAGTGLTDEQFFNWGANAQNPGQHPPQPAYNTPALSYPSQNMSQASNQLARRPMSQMVSRPPQQNNAWAPEQSVTPMQQQQQQPQQEHATTWSDDIDELLAKAQVAKREAQSKRKQIPPFVMKLHSFLENPKNTDLIRWADDGKSFVVLNEDEFANKLIPELFKHNNYASFVRQLNMYGFHKKVGLSDNSMRASERKAKSPSEYWNPFFRKGYSDLLWLIQKPKNQTANTKNKPRGKSEERDEEDEYVEEVTNPDTSRPRPQLALPAAAVSNNSALTTEQFQNVQRELLMIRRQQGQITQMLSQLKREHDALVDQANDYQNKHSRHEHSINAILTFLATLYNRSLGNTEGAQDIAKIFASTMGQDKGGSGVVDDHFVFDMPEGTSLDQPQQPQKRQRLMITDGSEGRANTMSPSTNAASPMNRTSRRSSHMARSPQSAHVEEIFDPDVNQPAQNYQQSSNNQGQQQQDMMSLIHNTNARNSNNNTPVPDFSHVLNDLETNGGTTPISASQRENMLRMFNDQSNRSRPGTSGSGALISPQRTNSQQMQFDNRVRQSSQGLDQLAQLQAQQEQSVENLTNMLQPLSPTGSIPGLGDGQDVPPPPLNIEDFFSNPDYFSNYDPDSTSNGQLTFPKDYSKPNDAAYNANGNTSGFDFNDDDPLFGDVDVTNDGDDSFLDVGGYDGGNDGSGRIQSVASSSEAPTPNTVVSDAGDQDGHMSRKRRKMGA